MKRAWCLMAAAVLLAWSSVAEARRLPGRAQVQAALNAWFACHAGPECGPSLRWRLTRLRCLRLPPDDAHPGRILCLYSGVQIGGGRPAPLRFENDCVYLMPARGGGWQVSSIPDVDVCE